MSKEYIDSLNGVRNGLIGSLRPPRGFEFEDCCEEFSFIREFDTINFNNKMNNLGLTHLVLDEDYNFTEVLERDLVNPIRYGVNSIFGIKGYTRSGKSELGETMVLVSKEANREYLNREVEFYLCYTWRDFLLVLKQIERGDIVLKDETPRGIGKGSHREKWAIENILHAIAKMENTFIFIDPLRVNVDICNLYLETAGMNRKTRTNRFMVLNEKQEYFGHIYVKLHKDDKFREWYGKQKDKFIDDIIENEGKPLISDDEKEIFENYNQDNYQLDIERNHLEKNSEFSQMNIEIYLRYEKSRLMGKNGESVRDISERFGFAKDSTRAYQIWKEIKKWVVTNPP